MDSAYRVRKRAACDDPSPTVKKCRRSPACGQTGTPQKGQRTQASRGRGLNTAADGCTPSKPPLSRPAVQPGASTCPAKEVLGSRKSVRRGKLPLPANYDLLLQLFGALQLVFRVNKMRGHHCVFQSARLAVEQQCGRRFLVSHLAQMKSVYPEVISLRYADIPKTSMQGQCSGTQLIIDMSMSDSATEPVSTLTAAPVAPSQSALNHPGIRFLDRGLSSYTTGGQNVQPGLIDNDTSQLGCKTAYSDLNLGAPKSTAAPSSTQAAIKSGGAAAAVSAPSLGQESVNKAGGVVGEEAACEGQAADSPGEPLRMMAVKAEFERRLEKQVMDHYKEFLETQGQAELAAVAVTRKQWEAGFDLESLPDIPQADLPPQPSQLVLGMTPDAAPTPAAVTGGKPPTAPRPSAPGARRLSFDSCTAGAELDSFRESHATEMTDEQVVQKLPEELRRQSLSGTLPVSLHTLRALQEQQAKREVMCSSDAKAARRKSAASAMLPRIFDTLRAMYGATGPATKLYAEVVIQLTGSNKGASSAMEVEDQLAVLAEAAPDWLSLESNIEGKKIVRLRRKADMKAVRQKLVLMSGTRP